MHLSQINSRSVEFLFVTYFLSDLRRISESAGFIQRCNEPVDCKDDHILRFLLFEDIDCYYSELAVCNEQVKRGCGYILHQCKKHDILLLRRGRDIV